jgi:hypothetical protein
MGGDRATSGGTLSPDVDAGIAAAAAPFSSAARTFSADSTLPSGSGGSGDSGIASEEVADTPGAIARAQSAVRELGDVAKQLRLSYRERSHLKSVCDSLLHKTRAEEFFRQTRMSARR